MAKLIHNGYSLYVVALLQEAETGQYTTRRSVGTEYIRTQYNYRSNGRILKRVQVVGPDGTVSAWTTWKRHNKTPVTREVMRKHRELKVSLGGTVNENAAARR